MRVVVVGGTGLIGSRLVSVLAQSGHDAVPASPKTGVNAITGEGLPDALVGAGAVVDVSNPPSFESDAVLSYFETSTSKLLSAEGQVGVRHHLALSVVGTDRLLESGYFRGKLAQERAIEASGSEFSIVRATQFFEFITGIADAATEGNAVRLPPVAFQPIAADDVARAVGSVVTGPPVNGTVEVAGPEAFRLAELTSRLLEARNDPREVFIDPEARYFGAHLSERDLLPDERATLGETRFDAWLGQSAPPGHG